MISVQFNTVKDNVLGTYTIGFKDDVDLDKQKEQIKDILYSGFVASLTGKWGDYPC